MTPDYYTILGVARAASDAELKQAYRRRARETHPDMGGDAREFDLVRKAWEALGTPSARVAYDRSTPSTAFPAFAEPEDDEQDEAYPTNPQSQAFFTQYHDLVENIIAEQVRRMAQEHASKQAEEIRGQQEVNALRVPLWPLYGTRLGITLGRMYASFRLGGVPYEQVHSWRLTDIWLFRGVSAAWALFNAILFLVIIIGNGLNLSNFMGWLFGVMVSALVGIFVLVCGIGGLQVHRWVNYLAWRKHLR